MRALSLHCLCLLAYYFHLKNVFCSEILQDQDLLSYEEEEGNEGSPLLGEPANDNKDANDDVVIDMAAANGTAAINGVVSNLEDDEQEYAMRELGRVPEEGESMGSIEQLQFGLAAYFAANGSSPLNLPHEMWLKVLQNMTIGDLYSLLHGVNKRLHQRASAMAEYVVLKCEDVSLLEGEAKWIRQLSKTAIKAEGPIAEQVLDRYAVMLPRDAVRYIPCDLVQLMWRRPQFFARLKVTRGLGILSIIGFVLSLIYFPHPPIFPILSAVVAIIWLIFEVLNCSSHRNHFHRRPEFVGFNCCKW